MQGKNENKEENETFCCLHQQNRIYQNSLRNLMS